MMFTIYGICFLISIGVLIYMSGRHYSNIDITYWTIVIIIPVILFSYASKAGAANVEEAELAMALIYLDSTILPVLMIFSMLKSFEIKVRAWVNMTAYFIAFMHLISIWACWGTTLYYSSFRIEQTGLGTVTKMTDGPLKIIHYIYLVIIFFAVVGVLAGCLIKKKDSSRQSLLIYGLFSFAALVFYLVEMIADFAFSILPFLYVVGDVIVGLQYENMHSHDLDCVIIDQKKEISQKGYVAFGRRKQLLCYNKNALSFVPGLAGKRIDARFGKEEETLRRVFYSLIDEFEESGKNTADHSYMDCYFRCYITYFCLHEGAKPAGYLFEIQDITAEQGYMNLIRAYGQSLEQDVNEKTAHIRFIQERIVLGMATIIENRDLDTGGHVRRTSDIIRIIVDEMKKQGIGGIDERFADEIVRSAPMHDLGKISIDNAILNKPGKLTDEEYAVMKSHSAKSGEIVEAILAGVEEPHFVQTAYQLARFHHERWDGKGYPERLAQIEIPLEARIMAVADVYDALVSERCYKQPMSFEQARIIMMEGMGTQFDPMMGTVFEACREKLEAYYSEVNKRARGIE